jgi:pimeloyl-ACP methyl ester carboxylesterase
LSRTEIAPRFELGYGTSVGSDGMHNGRIVICAFALALAGQACSKDSSPDDAMSGSGGAAGPAAATGGTGAGTMNTGSGGGTGESSGGKGGTAAAESGGSMTPPAMTDGGGLVADGGLDGGGSTSLPATKPIDPPVADDCITDVTAGDHTFSCSGLTFLVMVDPKCTQFACGLIFDTHGATMSGAQMRDNTHLHELAPPKGYLVVHPSATPENTGGTWDLADDGDPPKVADFMLRMIKAFHVDPDRVHFTGFSQGGAMTWYMLCHHNDVLASAAPVAGALNTTPCMGADWSPRVPILNMNGVDDQASVIANSRMLIQGIVDVLGLSGGEQIDGDEHWMRFHWESPDGMLLDSIEHDYGGQAVLGGHCIPGGTDIPGAANNFSLNATTCTTGDIKLDWGPTVLQFFIDHPRH